MTGLGLIALMVVQAINGKLTPLVPYFAYGGAAAVALAVAGFVFKRGEGDESKMLEGLAGLGLAAMLTAGIGAFAPMLLPYFKSAPVTTFAGAIGRSHHSTATDAKAITIAVRDQVMFGEREIVAITGRHLKAAGAWAMESPGERLAGRDIVIDQHAVVKDQYGNQKQEIIYSVRWAFDDLRRMQWQNLAADDVMRLGHIEPFVHMGLPILRSWCATDKDRYSNLCGQFLR